MENLPFERMVGRDLNFVEKLPGGINNPCYKVSCKDRTRLVVQIVGDKFPEKAKREPQLVNLLQELGIPVPKIVKVDISRDLIDRDYLVKEYVEGMTLDRVQANLSQAEIKEIYSQLGEILSRLHEKKFENFGRIEKKKQGFKVASSYNSFREYFIVQTFSWLEKEKTTPFEDKIPDLKAWIKEQAKIFETEISPRLTHNDLRPDNIIVEGGKIKGIIDLDNVKSSNIISDIYRIYRHFSDRDKSEKAVESFLTSYSKDSKDSLELPQNYEQQIEFYLLIHPLAYIDCWQQIKDDYSDQNLKKMRSHILDSIEKILNASFV